ncbi:MAG: hypothetical protein R6W70_09665 [bacterium]
MKKWISTFLITLIPVILSAQSFMEPDDAPPPGESSVKSESKTSTNNSVKRRGHRLFFNLDFDLLRVSHYAWETSGNNSEIKSSVNDFNFGLDVTALNLTSGFGFAPSVYGLLKFGLGLRMGKKRTETTVSVATSKNKDDYNGVKFILAPGIRYNIIDDTVWIVYAGGFLNIGYVDNFGIRERGFSFDETFYLSPEIFGGGEYRVFPAMSVGGKINLAYEYFNHEDLDHIHGVTFGFMASVSFHFM